MSMTPKELIFDEEAREYLADGVKQLADVVAFTLGPEGKNVGLEKSWGTPSITNDGSSILKDVELKNQYQNMGATVMKEAVQKTKDTCGDGTTTTAILLRALVDLGMKQIAAGSSPIGLKRGMEKAVEHILSYLEKNAHKISTLEEKKNIATVAASGNREMGTLIAEAFEKVGNAGVVTVEENKKTKDEIVIEEGMQFDRGYISPYFITQQEKRIIEMENPQILFVEKKITSIHDLLPLLQQAVATQKPILIIAEDIEGDALSTLVINKLRGTLRIAAVKAPGFGDRRKAMLEDIAVLTGATVVSEEKGMQLKEMDTAILGSAETITITKDTTLIVNGGGSSQNIAHRIGEIDREIENAENQWDKEKLLERKAKLRSGVAVIRVGGSTEPEVKEKKAKFQDSLNSTKAALEEGIVPGGGVALLRAAQELSSLALQGDEEFAVEIVAKTCEMPLKQIVMNAGFDGSVVLAQVKEERGATGFNATTGEIEDLNAAGVVDPVKVVKNAIRFAASAAGILWLSEVLIGQARDDDDVEEEAI